MNSGFGSQTFLTFWQPNLFNEKDGMKHKFHSLECRTFQHPTGTGCTRFNFVNFINKTNFFSKRSTRKRVKSHTYNMKKKHEKWVNLAPHAFQVWPPILEFVIQSTKFLLSFVINCSPFKTNINSRLFNEKDAK